MCLFSVKQSIYVGLNDMWKKLVLQNELKTMFRIKIVTQKF